jgi:phage shock protein C
MFCTGCGQEMQEIDRYCSRCGKSYGPAPAPRRLCRIMAERKIAGVCAGVARYFDVDVTIVRIVWTIVTLLTGVTLIGYLIAWVVIPSDEKLASQRQYA